MHRWNRFRKYLISFLKRDWDLQDYPVEVVHHDVPADVRTNPDVRPIAWVARVPYWIRMSGYGDTREEALAELRRKFVEYKQEGAPLPRPGTKVPLALAPAVEVGKYPRIARDFFGNILDMDYDNVFFFSDSSVLGHFTVSTDDAVYLEKIKERYGVDVSDIEDGNLARIFARISERGSLP